KAKLLDNKEYAQLAEVIKEAGAVERQHMNQMHTNKGQISEEEQVALRAARDRGAKAAERMKEIEFELNPETRWHRLAGWNAEDSFDDTQVIELCRAIERNDLAEMKRLIVEGADPSALGKQGMTPLLWAFPDRKIERFRLLLEHGADPNVIIE